MRKLADRIFHKENEIAEQQDILVLMNNGNRYGNKYKYIYKDNNNANDNDNYKRREIQIKMQNKICTQIIMIQIFIWYA